MKNSLASYIRSLLDQKYAIHNQIMDLKKQLSKIYDKNSVNSWP